jgi:hypothetical protein
MGKRGTPFSDVIAAEILGMKWNVYAPEKVAIRS